MKPTIAHAGLAELMTGFPATALGDWSTTIHSMWSAPAEFGDQAEGIDGHDLEYLVRDAINTGAIDLGEVNHIYIRVLADDPLAEPVHTVIVQVRLPCLRLLSSEPIELAELLPERGQDATVYVAELLHAILAQVREIVKADRPRHTARLAADEWEAIVQAVQAACTMQLAHPHNGQDTILWTAGQRLREQLG